MISCTERRNSIHPLVRSEALELRATSARILAAFYDADRTLLTLAEISHHSGLRQSSIRSGLNCLQQLRLVVKRSTGDCRYACGVTGRGVYLGEKEAAKRAAASRPAEHAA